MLEYLLFGNVSNLHYICEKNLPQTMKNNQTTSTYIHNYLNSPYMNGNKTPGHEHIK